MNFLINITLILFCLTPKVLAQEVIIPDTTKKKQPEILPLVTFDGDTLPHKEIREVTIFHRPKFKNRRQVRRYGRLVYNVKKVYPYAIYIRDKLNQVNDHLQDMNTEKEQKKYIRQVQKEMMDRFENDVRNMTFSQGKILIKLIDRETGNTSYIWIKDLKGNFFAGFWQTVARIFGSNLKASYHPKKEDYMIEQIVRMIEAGVI